MNICVKPFFYLGLLTLSVNTWAQKPHPVEKQAKFDAEVVKAMPSIKTLAKPGKERKILVLSKVAGWYHSSIETGKTCFQEMGKSTGAFTADVNDDPAFYTAENLKKYDAILFNNTTYSQDYFNETQRQAILGFTVIP